MSELSKEIIRNIKQDFKLLFKEWFSCKKQGEKVSRETLKAIEINSLKSRGLIDE